MNPKKPQAVKARSAGVSLEPELIRRGRVLSAVRGFNSFSALIRNLLVRELEQSGRADLRASEQAPAYAARGAAKIAKALGKKPQSKKK